jgi:hypothetical protein
MGPLAGLDEAEGFRVDRPRDPNPEVYGRTLTTPCIITVWIWQ